jgi:hypothetical protein
MNTSQKITAGAIAIPLSILLLFSSALADSQQGRGMGQGNGQGLGNGNYSVLENQIFTEEEKAQLIYGQQEERLAGDVYRAMYDLYQVDTFKNISESEDKHVQSMGMLLTQAGLEQTTGYGDLQETYDALIEKGNTSLKDAIEVGITVEILDIEDLDKVLAETENENIKRVYENLRKGSVNHLNAYVAQLQKNEFTTDLDWQKYTTQEGVDEKLECLNLSPEERAEKEAEKHAQNGKGQGQGEQMGKGKENAKGKAQAYSQGMKDKFLKKAKKAKNYTKFEGVKKERKTFTDEESFETEESSEAVYFLQERGILGGYPEGDFKPQKGISRVEALKIIVEATGESLEEVTESSFPDVDTKDWFAKYVEAAKKRGFVAGYKDGTFKPAKVVNQVELLKIAFNSFGIDLTDYETESTEWYGVYLQYATDNSLLDEDEVSPDQSMTREAFSKLVYRLIQQQEAL